MLRRAGSLHEQALAKAICRPHQEVAADAGTVDLAHLRLRLRVRGLFRGLGFGIHSLGQPKPYGRSCRRPK